MTAALKLAPSSDRRKTETKIQAAIVEAIRALGLYCLRVNSGGVKTKRGYVHLAPKGTPDILGALPTGHMFAFEVKAPGEKPTPEQLAWREMAMQNGIRHAVVYSPKDALSVLDAWHFAEQINNIGMWRLEPFGEVIK